ncbi:MAG: flotillin family protein [Winogradskyella sp.]|uniref:flotillin family protein n=1 Tax=Winogradskyella sp. TaxID=1883156 RepID=UPI001849A2DE|nr:flotillin family protein [Winogradskyella sp.]
MSQILILVGFLVFVLFLFLLFFISRYKRCPSDKILVVYGKTKGEQSATCYAGGATFVMPIFQDYRFLDLTPISIDVNLQDALSKQNIRVSVPAQFTVGVSNKPDLMIAAAERLLGLDQPSIRSLAHDIIMGQMRLVIANMDIEELNTDRDKFVESVYRNVGNELNKIGLELINVNVTDIQDESGYIQALGKEAAAKAINDAKIKVANEERTGAIGQAEAQQDQRVKVADANSRAEIGEAVANQSQRVKVAENVSLAEIGEAEATQTQRVKVAEANSKAEIGEADARAVATQGKNEANIKIANSNALRDIEVAEADRKATAARKVAAAKALEEAYKAEELAEDARAKKELARKQADEVVEADIEKQKAVIAAQAEAERQREIAKGEADAILAKYMAEAQGQEALLTKQAEGFQKLVEAAGGDPQSAIGYLMIDKLTGLAEIQTGAIKDLDIDKVVVYDNGSGKGVGNFVQGLYGMMPQLNDFLQQSGMSLPESLVKGGEEVAEEEGEKDKGDGK